jgi:hypothetical protein
MKILFVRTTAIRGTVFSEGEVLDADTTDARQLISMGKAVPQGEEAKEELEAIDAVEEGLPVKVKSVIKNETPTSVVNKFVLQKKGTSIPDAEELDRENPENQENGPGNDPIERDVPAETLNSETTEQKPTTW